jgi:hypothetical protein
MNPLDIPLASVPPEQLVDHVRALKAYVRDVADPNATGDSGFTCLRIALSFCNTEDGEHLVTSLLERGADPNRPTAFANFYVFMLTATRITPLEHMIRAGLKLNEVYSAEPGVLPTGRSDSFTLLDLALDVEAYLNTRTKRFTDLVEKHAGPLTGRRRFVADVIALLRSHGAIRAEDAERK